LFIHELDAESILNLMENEDLLMDDDIEMIKEIPNEQKKCQYIFSVLRRSSLISFQKFILLLSNNNLHSSIVAKILKGNIITLCVARKLLILQI